MYELTQEEIEQVMANIATFNDELDNLSADLLLYEQFDGPLEQQQEKIYGMVLAIDTLFVTSLRGRAHEIYQIISSLTNNWPDISERLNNPNLNIQNDPNQVFIEANFFLNIVFNSTGPAGWNHCSFATKFLHWCNCEHFPIMDSKSRISITIFQENHNTPAEDMILPNPPQGIENIIEDYKKWIIFYSSLIADNIGFINDLQNHDTETQRNTRDELFILNSPLRIFDKYFYIKGKE